jgi:hypothetical protein
MTDRRQAVAAAAVQPIRLLAIEARASVARLCAAIRAFGEQVDRDALPEATSAARGKSGDDEKTRGDRAALDTTNATPRNGACAGSK